MLKIGAKMSEKTERITFRVEKEVKDFLEVAAKKDARSLGSFLIKAGLDRAEGILGMPIERYVPGHLWELYRAG
jgi:uncharacterized protein (DUF1778 family)